ncbi:hypothetical protein SAMN04488589_0507 [Methanolobus vulcani]|uniref:Uncharacterized protein n=1 Tax=Methanolobus vulcani TaxID=38026 RepID=A0A7Z7FBQ0_9EURY|nr:hypothetical protein [Methanolobus vulcani]SDF43423.1 hypothetical protein SAMN04488589_0507 [Methanolobus vulcani]
MKVHVNWHPDHIPEDGVHYSDVRNVVLKKGDIYITHIPAVEFSSFFFNVENIEKTGLMAGGVGIYIVLQV